MSWIRSTRKKPKGYHFSSFSQPYPTPWASKVIKSTALERQETWIILFPPRTISVFLSTSPSPAPYLSFLLFVLFYVTALGFFSYAHSSWLWCLPQVQLRKIHCPHSVIIRDGCQGHGIKETGDARHIFAIHWLEKSTEDPPAQVFWGTTVTEKRRHIWSWRSWRDKSLWLPLLIHSTFQR